MTDTTDMTDINDMTDSTNTTAMAGDTRTDPLNLTAYPPESDTFLRELAVIPAPSGCEERRAEFCLDYLIRHGVRQAYIDEAGNVCVPFGPVEDMPFDVYMAHSDVVFDDQTELPLTEDGTWLACPGIADNTVHIAALIRYAIWLNDRGLYDNRLSELSELFEHPDSRTDDETASGGPQPFMFVINVGEEGLGNLKGSRAIVSRYGRRIRCLVTFDSVTREVVARAVGSVRWRITAETEGGHSFRDFGKPNAIVVLAGLIEKLTDALTHEMAALPKVPEEEEEKESGNEVIHATWNVGTIEGGTSVNTIAQNASMLFECRSDDFETLALMKKTVENTVAAYADQLKTEAIKAVIKTAVIGERPCMSGVDAAAFDSLICQAERAIRDCFGEEPVRTSGSTDANAALSQGIPAVCFGLCRGEGAHTRQERLRKDSLLPGLKAGWLFINRQERLSEL